jgi:hypothetical protein
VSKKNKITFFIIVFFYVVKLSKILSKKPCRCRQG